MPIETTNIVSVPEEELLAKLIECINCEASYSILLGENFLNDTVRYCPFCGDYIVGED